MTTTTKKPRVTRKKLVVALDAELVETDTPKKVPKKAYPEAKPEPKPEEPKPVVYDFKGLAQLQTQSFPLCCGMQNIYGFPTIYTDLTYLARNKAWVKQELERLRTGVTWYGGQLLILNDRQKAAYEKEVIEAGFEPISEGVVNTLHMSRLATYMRQKRPELQRAKMAHE